MWRRVVVWFAACVVAVGGVVVGGGSASADVGYVQTCNNYWATLDPAFDHYTYTLPDPHQYAPNATIITQVRLRDSLGREWSYRNPGGPIAAPAGAQWTADFVCVGIPKELPRGQILISKVSGRGVGLFGYAFDPYDATPQSGFTVIDERFAGPDFVADRPWIGSPQFPAQADNRSFLVLIGNLQPGAHDICLFARTDAKTPSGLPARAPIGCAHVVIK